LKSEKAQIEMTGRCREWFFGTESGEVETKDNA
jgi:hypothetical protein